MGKAKPFEISKKVVWEAYQCVKANQGAAGVDGQSISDFEEQLENNLYKIWNRMSSGSYFPPAVRTVSIPKRDGGQRKLGIPTVADRIAQMVVKMTLEPEVDPHFHPDSYGYRPGRSALEAVGVTRQRCWRYDWVLDLDIRGFFDNVDHELLLRAVRHYSDCRWILLYVERWLNAPVQLEDGTTIQRDKGVPQGSVISPLLANLFLHCAFDAWMQRHHNDVPFERYADDIIVHCKTEGQAQQLRAAIKARLAECKLELHPEKTMIVYCKDDKRSGDYPQQKFDFLGYTFRPRQVRSSRGAYFVGFNPAVSNAAANAMRQRMRRWRLHRRSDLSLEELAAWTNPVLRGWIHYYGRYFKSALTPVFKSLNRTLKRWAMRKYKRLRDRGRQAVHWLGRIAQREPQLFAHWHLLSVRPAAGR